MKMKAIKNFKDYLKKLDKPLPFCLERYFNLLLISIAIALLLGLIVILFTNKYSEYGFKLKDIFLIIIGLAALPQIFFAFREKRKNIRNEYVDRLVFKWHKEIIGISKNPVSVFSITNKEYKNFTKNNPKKIIINNQFQLIIDLISLIHEDITKPDFPGDKTQIKNSWVETIKDTVFKYELPVKLWTKKRETIEPKSRKWIDCDIINDT